MVESIARAQFFQSETETPYFEWAVSGKPVVVRIPYTLMDRLEREVVENFRSLTSRGSEIGGFLVGGVTPGNPSLVTLEDYRPVLCDYARGPLYRLSEGDLARFERSMEEAGNQQEGTRVIGFFRSHTRKGLLLDTEDAAFFQARFRESWQIGLLVRPAAAKTTLAAIFIKEGQSVRTESSYLEFPFRSTECRSLQAAEPPRPSPNPAGSRAQVVPIAPRAAVPEKAAPEPAPRPDPEAEAPAPAPEPPAAVAEPVSMPEPKPEPKPVVEPRPAVEHKPAAEHKVSAEHRPAAEHKPAVEHKAAPEHKPAAEHKAAAEHKISVEHKPVPAAEPEPAVASEHTPAPPAKRTATAPASAPAPVRRTAPAPSPAPTAAPVERTFSMEADAAAEAEGGSKWIWIVAAVAAILAIGIALFVYPGLLNHKRPAPVAAKLPPQDSSPLSLRVERTGGGLLLTWNRAAAAIDSATRATLAITDGTRHETYEMGIEELRKGSIVYMPYTQDISFRMEVTGRDQSRTASELVRVLRTSPMPEGQTPEGTENAAAAPPGPTTPAPAPWAQPVKPFSTPALAGRLRPATTAELPEAPSLGGRDSDSNAAALPASLNPVVSAPSMPAPPPSPAPVQAAAPRPAAPAPAAEARAPERRSEVRPMQLISRRDPIFPELARKSGASGEVRVRATVGPDGRVKAARAVSGHPLLRPAAIDAVKQWVYRPTMLNGAPIEAETEIVLNFIARR